MPDASDTTATVGKVTQVVGDAHIKYADGTEIKAEVGVAVHQGDEVFTSAKGALSILFQDNTTFAISENAHLKIDKFVYDPHHSDESSFFHFFQGVFVYTSGLIGKDDPAKVHIDTPVGTIGIRGTVVAGDISGDGGQSTITVADGAITFTNASGTTDLNNAFQTLTVNSYDSAPADAGQLSVQSFETTYSAVQPVAGDTFSALSGNVAPDNGTTAPDGSTTAPDGSTTSPDGTQAPDGSATPAPDGSHTTAPSDGSITAPDGTSTALLDTTMQLDTDAQTAASTAVTPAAQSSDTSFTTSSPTTFDTTGQTTFTSTTTSGASGSGALSSSPPPATGGTGGTGGTTTSSGGTTPPAPQVSFQFSSVYTHGTTTINDDALPLLGLGGSTMIDIGSIVLANFNPGDLVNVQIQGFDVNGDYMGNALQYNLGTTLTTIDGFDTMVNPTATAILHLDTNPASATYDHLFMDPLAMMGGLNGPYNFTITATDTVTGQMAQQSFTLRPPDFLMPGVTFGAWHVFYGDVPTLGGSINPDPNTNNDIINLFGTGGNNIAFGRSGADTMFGSGGQDILFGGDGNDILATPPTGGQIKMFGDNGNDTLIMKTNTFLTDGFSSVDGGAGNDSLEIGSAAAGPMVFNFELSNNVQNIENINIQMSNVAGTGQTVRLNFMDVFEMADPNDPTHTLNIYNLNTGYGSEVVFDESSVQLNGAANTSASVDGLGNTTTTITGTLAFNNQTVTLIIHQGQDTSPTTTDGIHVTVQ